MMLWLVLLLVSIYDSKVDGYGMGAPNSACDTRFPQHGVKALTTPNSYTITVSSTELNNDKKLQVNLTGSEPFKGFLLQALDAEENILGAFASDNVYKQLTCGFGVNVSKNFILVLQLFGKKKRRF